MRFIILIGLLAFLYIFYMSLFIASSKEDKYLEAQFKKFIEENKKENL